MSQLVTYVGLDIKPTDCLFIENIPVGVTWIFFPKRIKTHCRHQARTISPITSVINQIDHKHHSPSEVEPMALSFLYYITQNTYFYTKDIPWVKPMGLLLFLF